MPHAGGPTPAPQAIARGSCAEGVNTGQTHHYITGTHSEDSLEDAPCFNGDYYVQCDEFGILMFPVIF